MSGSLFQFLRLDVNRMLLKLGLNELPPPRCARCEGYELPGNPHALGCPEDRDLYDEDCCWIGDPCPIHNPGGISDA